MKPLTKVALVGAGYVAALVLAQAVQSVYVAATSGPDRERYASMFAFGDSLLFLAVFSVASVVPTSVALVFLRPYRAFWRKLSIIALTAAATAVAACLAYLTAGPWAGVAVLRILVAPPLALGFLVSGAVAPDRGSRIALLAAAVMEGAAFACVAAIWFRNSPSP